MELAKGFVFNRHWQQRNAILLPFVSPSEHAAVLDGSEDLFHFRDLPVEVVGRLIEECFLAPDDHQNQAPTTCEFFAFMQRHPEVKAHGYAVNLQRTDYRITIEGVSYRGELSRELWREAEQLFAEADEFQLGYNRLYVWYD